MKIACFVLIYDNIEIIKRSLSSITEYADEIDIHVVENPSEYTEDYIKPAMLNLLKKNKIKSYTLFDKNIRINAFISFFYTNHADIWNSDFLLITDGDIVAEGDWLRHQIDVLQKYNDVFCCSIEMSKEGWSQGLVDLFPKETSRCEDYIEIDSGLWMSMFRTKEFKKVFELFCDNRIMARDGTLKRFAKEYLRKKWVVTPKAIAYELTRAGYATPEYLFKKKKMITEAGGNQNFWVHHDFSGFHFYTVEKTEYYSGVQNLEFRSELEKRSEDWLAQQLNDKKLNVNILYFGINMKHIVKGSFTMGNSDTLSFYDRSNNTGFLRCNIIKEHEYQPLNAVFATIVLFDTFKNFSQDHWLKIVNFCKKAITKNGSIRFTWHKNVSINERGLDTPELFDELVRIMLKENFSNLIVVDYNPKIDLVGEKRYENRFIFESFQLKEDE